MNVGPTPGEVEGMFPFWGPGQRLRGYLRGKIKNRVLSRRVSIEEERGGCEVCLREVAVSSRWLK